MVYSVVQRMAMRCAAFAAAEAWCAWCPLAAEPEADRGAPSCPIARRTVERGLSQNTVRASLLSSDGYIWRGTLAGLARFTGVGFVVLNSSNTLQIPNPA